MPFRRTNLRLRPINRIKHVVDRQSAITAGSTEITNLANSVDAPVLGNTSEVQTGSTVNGFFLIVELYKTGGAGLSNAYLTIGKNPGGNVTLPAPNAVGVSDNKRFIFHQEMVMLQNANNGNPRTLFKGVIAIPRGYRRFAPDDRLQLEVSSPGANIDYCVQCHYKEFR